MADTAQGRRLTEAHRVAQVELSAEAIAAAEVVWELLDPNNIPGTRDEWLALSVAAVGAYDAQSAELAAEYLSQYRAAEGFAGGPIVDLDAFDAEWAIRSLDGYGPGAIFHRVRTQGISIREAKAASVVEFDGAFARHALQGGRRVVDQSALANPRSVGWRRVTDGDPCGWCAMLAARGPRYRSAASAGLGRKWHDWCGCTAEEIFGTWAPTADERQYSTDYETAAAVVQGRGEARSATAILAELRKLGYR